MGQVLHGSATTTEAIRRAIQNSQESLRALAKRYGINPKTVAKWKKRRSVSDLPTGPKDAKSTVLTIKEEAIIVAFRRHTLLPLDDCLYTLIAAVPYKIHTVLTDNGIQFTFPPRYADGHTARYMTHMFDMRCRENGIEHRLTKIKHPWTNGQVERMNRTIKEATVKRYHYDSHQQLEAHLENFVSAYNFARRLKTLRGLTPYEYICKIWETEPERFRLNPHHQMPGLNI
ncbi:MAG TPA: integrase core domain-containing protein [Magnetospirillum sp.]|nr:integrase core domain-containing protein [Magnetospirillum sp.]